MEKEIPDDVVVRVRQLYCFDRPVGDLRGPLSNTSRGTVRFNVMVHWIAHFDILFMEAKTATSVGVDRRFKDWESHIRRMEVVRDINVATRTAVEWTADVVQRFDAYVREIPKEDFQICAGWDGKL